MIPFKKALLFMLIMMSFVFYGQKKQCSCNTNNAMIEAPMDCETIVLKNKSKLYWQFNCNRIWLTLQNKIGKKTVINEVDIDLYGYTYRLGYHLIKEYKNSLLFRAGCPANGPCVYILINKTNGRIIKKFDQLICIDTDNKSGNAHIYSYDFVVYLSEDRKHMNVYFINTKKQFRVPFNFELTAISPEYLFEKMELKEHILTMTFEENNEKHNFKINLINK
jgi:hypothetical protein